MRYLPERSFLQQTPVALLALPLLQLGRLIAEGTPITSRVQKRLLRFFCAHSLGQRLEFSRFRLKTPRVKLLVVHIAQFHSVPRRRYKMLVFKNGET